MRRRIVFTVEKKRVLVPVGEPCGFGCRYCYTRGGEVGLSRVNMQEILKSFQEFMRENTVPFETIQFGYDGDPFYHPERGLAMLAELANTGKHINFSTKGKITSAEIAVLRKINEKILAAGKTLSALVSVSCWDSAEQVEPHTPSPAERMMTIKRLKEINIPVFIAVRPVLPHIEDKEYGQIMDEGLRAGCDGFILGPLYADAKGRFVRFIPTGILSDVASKTGVVPWSAHTPTWTRYEDTARLNRLQTMIEERGGQVFVSSADAMALVREQGNAATKLDTATAELDTVIEPDVATELAAATDLAAATKLASVELAPVV